MYEIQSVTTTVNCGFPTVTTVSNYPRVTQTLQSIQLNTDASGHQSEI